MRSKLSGMRRFVSILSLLAVFSWGAAFPIACLAACALSPRAELSTTSCHEEVAPPVTHMGSGFQSASVECPLWAAFEGRTSIAQPSPASPAKMIHLFSWPVGELKVVPATSSFFPRLAFQPPLPSLPLYLKNPVLRI